MRVLAFAIAFALLPACTPARTAHDSAESDPADEDAPALALGAKARNVLVTPDTRLGRYLDVVAVLDFHTKADSQEKGFDDLRRKAADLGADAVIGAEFEHGERGEPSHLSGIAVMYAVEDKRDYDVLGELDVETPEDADDKGFEKLKSKAWSMGADQVRNITFDHGSEGGRSHLRGTAVRHRAR